MITQLEYDVLKQTIRTLYFKINVLDFQFHTIGEISGNIVNGSINIDAKSDIRRTFNIDMIVTKSSVDISPDGAIWMNTFIQPFIGLNDIRSGEIVWYNQGIGIVDEPSWKFDPDTKNLSFTALDMVSLLDGTYSGNVVPATVVENVIVKANENVRDAIIETIRYWMGPIADYIELDVSECINVDGSIVDVPNDLEFSIDCTAWDILERLRNILPNYQMYFDVNGTFHYEVVPFQDNPYITMDDDMWRYTVLSEDVQLSFRDVYNYITVFGKAHDVKHFIGNLSYVNSSPSYLDGSSTTATLTDKQIYGFTTTRWFPSNQVPYIKFGNKMIRVFNEDGSIPSVSSSEIIGEEYLVVMYDQNGYYNGERGAFVYFGHQTAMGTAIDDNPNSPFNADKIHMEKKKTLTGGDYDYIYTDDLCCQRAEWEIYQSCRVNDTIQLVCIPIYFLDVNDVVRYTSYRTGETNLYIVQSISTDWSESGTMSITLQRYYPFYK